MEQRQRQQWQRGVDDERGGSIQPKDIVVKGVSHQGREVVRIKQRPNVAGGVHDGENVFDVQEMDWDGLEDFMLPTHLMATRLSCFLTVVCGHFMLFWFLCFSLCVLCCYLQFLVCIVVRAVFLVAVITVFLVVLLSLL